MLEANVFDRTETTAPLVSDLVYYRTPGLKLCWGFGVNWLMLRNMAANAIAPINP